MRERLLQILNNKLDDIKQNISSLEELNTKIANENKELDYIEKVLESFGKDEDFDVLSFIKLTKENFDHILGIVNDDVRTLFDAESCNYEGLVYLIEGIKNGVSISLTEEQENAIASLVHGLKEKKEEKKDIVDGLLLAKSRFVIDDIEVLNSEKEKYLSIIEGMDKNTYIDDTYKIIEAMHFNRLDDNEIIDILSYILEYNAHIYDGKSQFVPDFNNEQENVTIPNVDFENTVNEEKDFNQFIFNPEKDINSDGNLPLDIPSPFESVEEEKTEFVPDFSVESDQVVDESKNDELSDIVVPPEVEEQKNVEDVEITPSEVVEYSLPNEFVQFDTVSSNIENDLEKDEVNLENNNNELEQPDNDFGNLMTSDDYETISGEIQELFSEYGLGEELQGDELREGNVSDYRVILKDLKDNDILDDFILNKDLFDEVMLYSGKEEIDEVLRIIKEDLSVDESDYKITLKLVISTIPTIFIKDGGSYDNFVQNTRLFKEIGLNLISLFDFSKEIFVASHDRVAKNYEIVKKYNIDINYKNAKYLLMLPDIDEKMDYYVESVYPDKTKGNQVFDGITYINDYAVKLNNVCDLVIKRLRFASETGHKVFGSKPNSLASEITNLKVDTLEIDDIYLARFFNNEFDGLTFEETREFIKLIHNSSNVGNYADELSILDKYRDNMRYVINGINISYNKVNRIYNILRSYGINSNKALHFAICYNLVITKDEYSNLKNVLDELGGNL